MRALRALAALALAAGLVGPIAGCGERTEAPRPSATSALAYPEIEALRFEFPIESGEWTIWPGPLQTRGEWIVGHPLELSPFTWDFLELRSAPEQLEIDPHYGKSTWDTFFVDLEGTVEVHAYGGLFRHTFGDQPRLLRGVVCTVTRLRERVEPSDPQTGLQLAAILAQLEQRIAALEARAEAPRDDDAPPDFGDGFGAFVARSFWGWKLGGDYPFDDDCPQAGDDAEPG